VEIFVEQSPEGKSVRLMYSDGLESFSILEAPRPISPVAVSSSRQIRIMDKTAQVVSAAEVNLIHWHDQRLLYTLIGSQPQAELLKMSSAIIAAGPRTPPPPPPPPPPQPRKRGFGEIMARGWSRLLRLLGKD